MNYFKTLSCILSSSVFFFVIYLFPNTIKSNTVEPETRSMPSKNLSRLSFYFFRTKFNPVREEMRHLENLQPEEIVFRLFDVDIDNKGKKATVISPLQIDNQAAKFLNKLEKTKISGLVFITNRSIMKTAPDDISALAVNILKKVDIILNNHRIEIRELQIDCDWNTSTREKYFMLLEQIQTVLKKRNIPLSATIRLHQIKFREKTGIPPVAKGILMFYNMDDPGKWETKNSVLDINIAKQYTERLGEYPLPLDLALPLYSQTVIFSDGHITGLIAGNITDQLKDTDCYENISPGRFRAKKMCLLRNNHGTKKEISAGSLLRFENTGSDELLASLNLVLSQRNHIRKIYIYDYHQALYTQNKTNVLDHLKNKQPLAKQDANALEKKSQLFLNKQNLEILYQLSEIYRTYCSDPGFSCK